VGSFAIGIFLALTPWPNWWLSFSGRAIPNPLQEVLQKLGDALIIAPLIALLVDTLLKEKLLTEFARDVSAHIIGYHLPVELREHIRHYLEIVFIRRRWEIIYNIRKWPGQPGYLELEVFSQYEMENRSDTQETYPFSYEVEESWFPIGTTRMTAVKLGDGRLFDEKGLGNRVSHERGNIVIRENVEIEPHDPESIRTYDFRTESIQCYEEGSSYASFIARYAVMGATVTVYYPKDELRLALDPTFHNVRAAHPEKDAPNIKKEDLGKNGTRWTIYDPILPGQGFFL